MSSEPPVALSARVVDITTLDCDAIVNAANASRPAFVCPRAT